MILVLADTRDQADRYIQRRGPEDEAYYVVLSSRPMEGLRGITEVVYLTLNPELVDMADRSTVKYGRLFVQTFPSREFTGPEIARIMTERQWPDEEFA